MPGAAAAAAASASARRGRPAPAPCAAAAAELPLPASLPPGAACRRRAVTLPSGATSQVRSGSPRRAGGARAAGRRLLPLTCARPRAVSAGLPARGSGRGAAVGGGVRGREAPLALGAGGSGAARPRARVCGRTDARVAYTCACGRCGRRAAASRPAVRLRGRRERPVTPAAKLGERQRRPGQRSRSRASRRVGGCGDGRAPRLPAASVPQRGGRLGKV